MASESAAESASKVYPVKSTAVIVLLPFMLEACIPPTSVEPVISISFPICNP